MLFSIAVSSRSSLQIVHLKAASSIHPDVDSRRMLAMRHTHARPDIVQSTAGCARGNPVLPLTNPNAKHEVPLSAAGSGLKSTYYTGSSLPSCYITACEGKEASEIALGPA